MFIRHDTIEQLDFDGEGKTVVVGRLKIIYADQPTRLFAVVDTAQPKTWPVLYSFEDGEEMVEANRWRIVEGVAPSYPVDADVPENHIRKRDVSWDMVASLVAAVPSIFVKKHRAAMVSSAAKTHGTTTITIRSHLRDLFHGGMNRSDLIPGWANVGNPGNVFRRATGDHVTR